MVDKEILTNAITNVLTTIGSLYEVQKVPLERLVRQKEAKRIRMFRYSCIFGRHEYDLLLVTVIPGALEGGRYLVPSN